MNKEKLLLHCCCAPCITVPMERLSPDHDLELFFYNPNIQPEAEYQQRLNELKKYAAKQKLNLVIGEYDNGRWETLTKDLAAELEGGKRCFRCYELRLGETANQAKQKNIPWFTSTLSISPHKNAEVINLLGQEIAKKYALKYYQADFKKKDGFKRSLEISKQEDFYRQSYCGCLYSRDPVEIK
ncbi:epoxyqueuosine reductase QueH [Candidatus Margulisiibacteriota bacterium]